ncbi:aromatic ring-hydroxylating dioxygenase subunit alpha [Enterobacter hormaechei]|uniref:aromatic ring-hydroxylating dioxygenase subunit alpha n=1 Tax=Enterobacter hormaechei TaxID=158836 RepID=UPI0029493D27|nr:aromatic ring-hydroxylating dioxygenase subunit alpha [Enterobacter hormaechei]MDV5373161.1 aromatic ring-hydroxylating dioxygenase subunit alpha [Enterobacter hormaechei]
MTTSNNDVLIENILSTGLKDHWFPVIPARMLGVKPLSLRRLGYKIVMWRDEQGKAHALEDHCPHRGAQLSMGAVLGNRLQCPYHGMEVRYDGTVTRVPGSPGCQLEGSRAARTFHVREAADTLFIYNATNPSLEVPPELDLPDQLSSDEWSYFLCYTEWRTDYRYVLDNVMDPMHGAYLHKISHSMSEGETSARFVIHDTDRGFLFEKEGQRGINFDWSEFIDNGCHWVRLAIPYPRSGGPGGNFTIIGSFTPGTPGVSCVFHWRCRPVQGWQRSTWRFLYRNRLEARHWAVLEQDRCALENMEPQANQRENLYQHDIGLVRLRRYMKSKAQAQLEAQS